MSKTVTSVSYNKILIQFCFISVEASDSEIAKRWKTTKLYIFK